MSVRAVELPAEKESASETEPDLFRHKKRPEWGVAILAYEREHHRAYQFEDGRLRKLKDGYYSLMEPAVDVRGSPTALVEGLRTAIRTQGDEPAPPSQKAVAPFSAQVELFQRMYPGGFSDPAWIDDHRRGAGRPLKRHRDPVVAEAQEALGQGPLDLLIEGDRPGDIAEIVVEIFSRTTLVPLKYVKQLRQADEDQRRALGAVIPPLLHGDGSFRLRFKRYLAVLRDILGTRPPWRLATALPALMFPAEHVCVRRSSFLRQAGSIAPRARYTEMARVQSYENFRRVAEAVAKRLRDAGHEPKDLLDVHDFIWATLRKSALQQLPGG